jgi:hypothetical protein
MRCFVFSAGEMGVGPVGVAPAQPFAHIYPGERIWTDGSLVIQAWIRICLRGGVWLSVYQWLRGSRNEFVVRTPCEAKYQLGGLCCRTTCCLWNGKCLSGSLSLKCQMVHRFWRFSPDKKRSRKANKAVKLWMSVLWRGEFMSLVLVSKFS